MTKSTRHPTFSVVIPAYNAEAHVARALRSIQAQTYNDWEIIIVDDGSTDSTFEIVSVLAGEDSRIAILQQENAGTGAAIAAGIENTRGEFVIQLGSDDELLPNHMQVIDSLIKRAPAYDIYAANAYRVYPDGSRKSYHTTPRFSQEFSLTLIDMLQEPQIFGSSSFRREWYARVGGFDHAVYNEDYDFWLRIMKAGARHIYTPEFLSLYYIGPDQKTADEIRVREDDIHILKKLIATNTLTSEEIGQANRSIELLRSNIAFRKRMLKLLGPTLANGVFSIAHKLAWIIRPYRK